MFAMHTRRSRLVFIFALQLAALVSTSVLGAEDPEPIAYIGHGAFFDRNGKQITLTQEFIAKAHTYYRQKLLSSMSPEKAAGFSEIERNLPPTTNLSPQSRLVLQNRFIASLVTGASSADAGRISSIINALDYALRLQIPEREAVGSPSRMFVPDVTIRDLLEKQALHFQAQTLAATLKNGQQYIDECKANGVPIPPPVGKLDPNGTSGWKSLGYIPKDAQFITGTPAELRVFTSSNPVGMCFSLPRYADDSKQTIALDGVICLGQSSSKVCFWDNQMPVSDGQGGTFGKTFSFAVTEQIPIGVPDLKVDPKGRFQGGGIDLNNGQGGVCTNCHAGENPYIIHPKVDLGGGVLMGKLNKPPLNLPTFSMNRYDPLVPASWPQNSASEAASRVPSACGVCHEKDGLGGRFPQLSSAMQEYCGTILRQAIEKTMPPNKPGSLKDDTEIKNFLALCQSPLDVASSDTTP